MDSAPSVVLAWQSTYLFLLLVSCSLHAKIFAHELPCWHLNVPICSQGIRRGWAAWDGEFGREGLGIKHQVPRAQECCRRRRRQPELPRHLRQRPSLNLSLPPKRNPISDCGFPYFERFLQFSRLNSGSILLFQLYTWGWNQRGTLGHPPETKTESVPGLVDALAGVKIVQVLFVPTR